MLPTAKQSPRKELKSEPPSGANCEKNGDRKVCSALRSKLEVWKAASESLPSFRVSLRRKPTDQVAALTEKLANEAAFRDRILGELPVSIGAVRYASWGAAARAMHSANSTTSDRGTLAAFPAPLGRRSAPRSLVYRQAHEIGLLVFRPPPSRRAS